MFYSNLHLTVRYTIHYLTPRYTLYYLTLSRRYTEGCVHIKVRKYLWRVVWNLTRQHSVYVDLQGILERENKTEKQSKICLSAVD